MGGDIRNNQLVSTIENSFRDDFSGVFPSGEFWTVAQSLGQMVSASGGLLTLASGVTPNEKTTIRSVQSFTLPFRVSAALSLSQRIANQTFSLRAVSEDGLDKIEIQFGGVSATSSTAVTQNDGNQTAAAYPSVSSATQALHEFDAFIDEVYFSSRALNSLGGVTTGRIHQTNIPAYQKRYFVELEVLNGSTAPASSTVLSCDFITVQDISEITAEITGGRGSKGAVQAVPVSIAGVEPGAPGGAANSPSFFVLVAANNTQGATTHFRRVSTADTNAAQIKATAGQLYALRAYNTALAVRYLKLHNVNSVPVPGSTPIFESIPIPPGGYVQLANLSPNGLRFSAGIAMSITAGAADSDAAAVAAGDVVVQADYI